MTEFPSPDQAAAKLDQSAAEALRLHRLYRGKVQIAPKCPIGKAADLSVWYTPGVAEPCKAIYRHRDQVYEYTNRANLIAVVSDGSRVLGLGDIGPEAGLPVMEGKALLFKYLGGVDAVPLCLRVGSADDLVRVVEALAPSFGGINLEDIAQPKCFRILDRLRSSLDIPVWHDDQQGTATVVLAALFNALKLVGKSLGGIRIAMIGVGAANVATYRLLKAAGAAADAIIACDSQGTLHAGRADIERRQDEFGDKWRICRESNAARAVGGIGEALSGADVCIAFSRPGPGIIDPRWLASMAPDAIVFACANPVPEVWPWEAKQAGARIVATGRGDFGNQLNNSLAFPGIFRGVLDVRARSITDEMAMAAASELAACAEPGGVSFDRILPDMADPEVPARLAVAVAMTAQRQGIAAWPRDAAAVSRQARQTIEGARAMMGAMLREGIIAAAPEA